MADTTQGARRPNAKGREARAADGVTPDVPTPDATIEAQDAQDRQPSAALEVATPPADPAATSSPPSDERATTTEGDGPASDPAAGDEPESEQGAPDPFAGSLVADPQADDRKFPVTRLLSDPTLLGVESYIARAAFGAREDRPEGGDEAEELTVAEGQQIVAAFLDKPLTTASKD
jgi:hypothetical protein